MRAFSKNTQNNNKPTALVSQRKYAGNTHFININKIQIVATTNLNLSPNALHLGISATRDEFMQAGLVPAIPKPCCVNLTFSTCALHGQGQPWPLSTDVGSAPKAPPASHQSAASPCRGEGTQMRPPPSLSVGEKGGSRGILRWFLQYLWVHGIWP